jgi:hypothetical protein
VCSNTAAGLAVLPTSACDLHVPHSTVCKCCWCRGCMGMFCKSAVWVGITGCPPMQQSHYMLHSQHCLAVCDRQLASCQRQGLPTGLPWPQSTALHVVQALEVANACVMQQLDAVHP